MNGVRRFAITVSTKQIALFLPRAAPGNFSSIQIRSAENPSYPLVLPPRRYATIVRRR
jgi:hypothetical protein